jgi:histone deacetylase 11
MRLVYTRRYNIGFPGLDRIDCALPLPFECPGTEYLGKLEFALPGFLDAVGKSARVGLAVYNAGTDVYEHDTLGNLRLSAADVLRRDLYVISQLRARGIPVVMLLSGGYGRESYRLVANTVVELLRRYGRTGG